MTQIFDFPETAGTPAPAPNSPEPAKNPAMRAAEELDAYCDMSYGTAPASKV